MSKTKTFEEDIDMEDILEWLIDNVEKESELFCLEDGTPSSTYAIGKVQITIKQTARP